MSEPNRRDFVIGAIAGGTALIPAIPALALPGDPPVVSARPAAPPGIKTFWKMPRSGIDIAAAHLNAKEEGTEFLQKGEPVELNSFALRLTKRDGAPLKGGKMANPSTRRFVLSVGIELSKEDQAKLPALSKGKILEYLATHYVSVQARIQRDLKGNQYLSQRSIVATANFKGPKLTEDFDPAVSNSVKEIRSLGMYLPIKLAPTPENLRTAVLVHKHTGIDAVTKKVEPQYEFIIFRGRATLAGKLDLYCFVTSDERTKLHFLRPNPKPPLRVADCTLKAQVYFSRFVDAGLVPADSVARSQTVTSQASFLMKDVDAFVKTQLKLIDTFTNLNEALDAIIDGKLKPEGQAPTGVPAAQPKVGSPTTQPVSTGDKASQPK